MAFQAYSNVPNRSLVLNKRPAGKFDKRPFIDVCMTFLAQDLSEK